MCSFAIVIASTKLFLEEPRQEMQPSGGRSPLQSFCTQTKHCFRLAGTREVLGDSGEALCISATEVTEVLRYHSASCWNTQLSLTATIYELAAGSAGFRDVSEVSLYAE